MTDMTVASAKEIVNSEYFKGAKGILDQFAYMRACGFLTGVAAMKEENDQLRLAFGELLKYPHPKELLAELAAKDAQHLGGCKYFNIFKQEDCSCGLKEVNALLTNEVPPTEKKKRCDPGLGAKPKLGC